MSKQTRQLLASIKVVAGAARKAGLKKLARSVDYLGVIQVQNERNREKAAKKKKR